MEMMTLIELAGYLHRDAREVSKLANRGKLPGQKVGGEWRFSRTEIDHWLELQLPSWTDVELALLETGGNKENQDNSLLSSLIAPESVAVPLNASTKGSVLRGMVDLAEQTWKVYDRDAILQAITRREEMASTALPYGVAIPHPHRPLPGALEESLIAYGRTARGIPFGGDRGALTDIYFLVCCDDPDTHVRVMARLSRLLLRPEFVDSLREAGTVEETISAISEAEKELVDM